MTDSQHWIPQSHMRLLSRFTTESLPLLGQMQKSLRSPGH